MHSNPDPERSFGSISFPIRGSPLFRFPLFDEMKFFLSLSRNESNNVSSSEWNGKQERGYGNIALFIFNATFLFVKNNKA